MELRQECGFPVEQAKAIVTNNDARTDYNKMGMSRETMGMKQCNTGICYKTNGIIAN